MTNDQTPLFGEKTFEDWNQSWFLVPGGLQCHQSDLTEEVGLYHYTQNGQSMALGTGTDKTGGLAKRPSDFIRPSSSGRNHHAGRLIFEHRKQLELWVLITGSGRQAREIARRLKEPMMAFHQPAWNVPNPSSVAKAKVKVKAKPQRSPSTALPPPGPYGKRGSPDAGTATQPLA